MRRFDLESFLLSPLILLSLLNLARRMTYIKARNTFILPEIIFDLSLVLSPYITLLGLIFVNNTFLALSLTLITRISELNISLGYE